MPVINIPASVRFALYILAAVGSVIAADEQPADA